MNAPIPAVIDGPSVESESHHITERPSLAGWNAEVPTHPSDAPEVEAPEDPDIARAKAKLAKYEARLAVKAAKSERKRQLREQEAVDGSATVRPDRVGIAVATVLLVAGIMLASMVFSFTALTAEAKHTYNPDNVLWLAPVFIDGAILAYTVSYAIFRWRGMPVKRTITVLIIWTTVSVIINFFHVGNGWQWDWDDQRMWVGMLIACAAPIAALTAAEEITRMVFVNPRQLARHRAADEAEVAPAVEPDAEDTPAPPVTLGPPLALPRPTTSALFPVGDRS